MHPPMTEALPVEEARERTFDAAELSGSLSALSVRVRGEYREMPGLRLTVRQAARLFAVPHDVADAVLRHLHGVSILTLSSDGAYSLIVEQTRWKRAPNGTGNTTRARESAIPRGV
jgi:hypothetical protein